MILWFVVGLVVWILCVLFILAIFKGGNVAREYEQKQFLRYMGKTVNVGDSVKEIKEGAELVLHNQTGWPKWRN